MTLFEYFQQKGQALPDIPTRRTMFGLGADYIGTEQQNIALLAKLQAQPAPGIAPTATTSPLQPQFPNLASTAPNQAVLDIQKRLDETLGQLKIKQDELAKAKAYEIGLGKTGGEIPSAVIQPVVTPQEAKREGRITGLEAEAFAPATKTWSETYKQAYEDAKLADVKTKVDEIDVKINKARDDLVTAEAGITENPWLTETGRVGRIRTLYDMAEKQINNLIDQRNQIQNTYSEGVRQAENAATRTQAETEAGRKLKAEELDYLNKLRTEKPAVPTTFGTAETGYYTWEIDPTTGKFIQKQVVAPTAKTPTTPTSYQEWTLAGKPGTYADWVNKKTANDQKIIDKFNTDLSKWDKFGTREQFIRQLQARFPDINKDDIAKKVYEVYPDNYNN